MDYIQLNDIPIQHNFPQGVLKRFYSILNFPIERLTGLHKIDALYARLSGIEDNRQYLQALLSDMNINIKVKNDEAGLIPHQGRVIVVANHPFGGLEGVILASILTDVRQDVKILANYLLKAIQPLRDLFLFVDPFEQKDSVTNNFKSMKDAVQWVKSDKMLVIFPAGAVSHFQSGRREISDPPWSTTVARLIRKTEASVLPIFFAGANSYLFQILGLIHPLVRTALLPRELINKKGKTITVEIGKPIPWEKLSLFADEHDLTDYLRVKTYNLQGPHQLRRKTGFLASCQQKLSGSVPAAIISPLDKSSLNKEVEALPRHQLLLESGDYTVYFARAKQVPQLLREIGRLREITFRQAHEGTGRSLDLDRFDPYYLHLFLWNRNCRELVGAYRLGQADYIVKHMGMQGLYTSTLFKFKEDFLKIINPALELGRSFVRPEYQKNYSSLLLLWKGIGAWAVQNPRYRNLFGPVSINDRYHTISQSLIAHSLHLHDDGASLSRLVKPRNAFPLRAADRGESWPAGTPQDINRLSDLIADIEDGNQGIPILLKQYLKMGGQVLAYNRDLQFSNVLDGLILVDLARAPQRLLERFMGKTGMASFLARHSQVQVSQAVGQ